MPTASTQEMKDCTVLAYCCLADDASFAPLSVEMPLSADLRAAARLVGGGQVLSSGLEGVHPWITAAHAVLSAQHKLGSLCTYALPNFPRVAVCRCGSRNTLNSSVSESIDVWELT